MPGPVAVPLGAPTANVGSRVEWDPPPANRAFPAALVEGGGAAFLRYIGVFADGFMSVWISPADSSGGIAPDRDLIGTWEESTIAIVFAVAGQTYTVPGPAHDTRPGEPGDRAEPYNWTTPEALAFFNAYRAATPAQRAAATYAFPIPPDPTPVAVGLANGAAATLAAGAVELAPGQVITRPTGAALAATGAGSLAAGVARTIAVSLASLDTDGRDVEFAAVIERADPANLYATPARGGTDAPTEGQLGIGPDETRISRITWFPDQSRLRLNDNNFPVALNLLEYFGADGPGNDLTLHVITGHGVATAPIADLAGTSGGDNFINLGVNSASVVPPAMAALLSGIGVGTPFLIAATRERLASPTGATLAAGGATLAAGVRETVPDAHPTGAALEAAGATVAAGVAADVPDVEPAGAAFEAAGATLAAGVRETVPVAEPAGAALEAAGAALAAGVRETVPDVEPVGAAFEAAGATLQAGVRAVDVALSLFDTFGLDVDFAFVAERSDADNLYADASRGGADAPLEGENGYGPAETRLSRVTWFPDQSRLRLNDNNLPAAGNLLGYFGAGGAGNDLTLYVLTRAGLASAPIAQLAGTSGGDDFLNLGVDSASVVPAPMAALLSGIQIGDLFLLAAARPIPADPVGAGLAAGATTELAAGVRETVPDAHPVGATLEAAGATLAAGVAADVPDAHPVGARLAAGATTELAAGVRETVPDAHPVGAALEAAGATLAAGVRADVPDAHPVGARLAAAGAALAPGVDQTVPDVHDVGARLASGAATALRAGVRSALPPGVVSETELSTFRSLSGQDPIYAIEITHASLAEPARFVGDSVEYQIGAHTFTPLAMRTRPPQSKRGEIRQARLECDNIGRAMMDPIERTNGLRGARIRLMRIHRTRRSNPSVGEIAWETTMDVGAVEATDRVAIRLTDEPIHGRPAVIRRHDPVTSPGIF